jgi:Meiotically up-regulated gene 113
MAKKTLNDILSEDDSLGLLANLKPGASSAGTSADQRARQKLEEVNLFVDRNHRMPGESATGVKIGPTERMLQFALNGLRANPAICQALKPFDRHGLLPSAPEEAPPASIDDIIASGSDLLTTEADDIFTFEHAPRPVSKTDRKAERKPCDDFSVFAPLFDACAADLQSGRRKSREFRMEQEIQTGEFFILNGTMLYVAEVNEPHIRSGKANARLRLIFDNATESDNLLRSLAAELYKDGPAGRGRRVTSPDAGPLFSGDGTIGANELPAQPANTPTNSGLSEADVFSGQVYVVRSLSTQPEIRKLDGHLFKIGFTTGDVETRILAAKDDPTFLLAPVRPVKTYTVYNLNTVKMENLLHRFFGDARLDIEIKDRFGKPCRPREWFLVPLDIVDEAIKRLLDGSIVHYRYDKESGRIVGPTA